MGYNDEYKGPGGTEVKDRIIPLLVAMENGDDTVHYYRGRSASGFRSCDWWKTIFVSVLR